MVVLTPLHLTVDEVVVGEAQSRRLEVTLLTVGIKMVLGLRAVAGAIVEELGCCGTTVLVFHLFTGCVGLAGAATDLELGLLLTCVRCASLLSLT